MSEAKIVLFLGLMVCSLISWANSRNSPNESEIVVVDYFLTHNGDHLVGLITAGVDSNYPGATRATVDAILPPHSRPLLESHQSNLATPDRYRASSAGCRALSDWETRQLRLQPGECRSFVVTLNQATNRWGMRAADPHNRLWQLQADSWLPRANLPVRLQWHLPQGFQISSPWPFEQDQQPPKFTVEPSPLNKRGVLIFGEFSAVKTTLAGMELDIAYLGNEQNYEKIYLWLTNNLRQLSATLGGQPIPSLQVIISPANSTRSRSPVPFGHVIRAGNHSVQYFVDTHSSYSALMADWTAAHEFSHLLLPFLGTSGKWVSEGFASYYQNLLMAHLGEYSQEQAWRKLLAGFARAKSEWPVVSPNDSVYRNLGQSRMMIYWSGAAFALLADVEIRKQSEGRQSLNTVLKQLADCCLPSSEVWHMTELFNQLDEFTPTPIFMPLYRKYANAKGLPDVEPTLKELGVSHKHLRRINLVDAPLSAMRDQIMSRPVTDRVSGNPQTLDFGVP